MGLCNKCHSKITDDDLFCPNCGASTKFNAIETIGPKSDYSSKSLIKKILLSYYIVFMIDIIGLGVLFLLFNNSYSTNAYDSMAWGPGIMFVLSLLIGVLQSLVFFNQFKVNDNNNSYFIKKGYLFIPTGHAFILIGIVIFINAYSSTIYFNFLSYLLTSILTGGLIVGFLSLYYRVTAYYKAQPIPDKVDLPPDYQKIVEDKKKRNRQTEQEEIFTRQARPDIFLNGYK